MAVSAVVEVGQAAALCICQHICQCQWPRAVTGSVGLGTTQWGTVSIGVVNRQGCALTIDNLQHTVPLCPSYGCQCSGGGGPGSGTACMSVCMSVWAAGGSGGLEQLVGHSTVAVRSGTSKPARCGHVLRCQWNHLLLRFLLIT